MGSNGTEPRKRVGARVSRNLNQVYQAATDGYIKAFDTHTGGSGSAMQIACDPFNPPTTVVDQSRNDDGNALTNVSWLVAKGEYYKVVWAQTGTAYWRPLEP